MPRRFPLFAKIFCWFLLNLALLGTIAFLAMEQQLRLGLDSLLAGPAGDRVRSVALLIAQELDAEPQSGWNAILTKYDRAYPVHFSIFQHRGEQLAGTATKLPARVQELIASRPHAGKPPADSLDPPPPDRRRPPPRSFDADRDDRPPPPPEEAGDPPPPRPLRDPAGPPPEIERFDIAGFLHVGDPRRYWVVVNGPFARHTSAGPVALIIASDTLGGGGLMVDFQPVAWCAGIALAVSALFWLPMIGSITSEVKRLRDATAEIAEGRFGVRVPARRRDELGDLGESVNLMAQRLSGFVQGQRRFLSDIAHELCAPLSRLQLALGILEERAAAGTLRPDARLSDVREEVDQMATLVNDLLSFSKASFAQDQVRLVPVDVTTVLKQLIRRENIDDAKVKVLLECEPGTMILADAGLLARAAGNLVRNAIRYAAHAGPICVAAVREPGAVVIIVSDAGPGVPSAALAQLFDPFFRVDSSRTRQTGGVGLGMTIAKTCVESCGGSISAQNNPGGGLRVAMRFTAATDASPAED